MRIEIEIPLKEEVLQVGENVRVAPNGESWSGKQLGEHARDSGVYIIHHGGSIKYVGQAFGLSFAERLRREFHERAALGGHIYPKLAKLTVPPEIKVTLFPLSKVGELVTAREGKLDNRGRAAIFEQAMIHAYRPEFQIQE